MSSKPSFGDDLHGNENKVRTSALELCGISDVITDERRARGKALKLNRERGITDPLTRLEMITRAASENEIVWLSCLIDSEGIGAPEQLVLSPHASKKDENMIETRRELVGSLDALTGVCSSWSCSAPF